MSIIIPTLNEAQNIRLQWNQLQWLEHCEFIFVDGGSEDGTDGAVQSLGDSRVRFLRSARGRAIQMNTAARESRGQWLIFLHADTILPRNSFQAFLDAVISFNHLEAGAFTLQFDQQRFRYRYLQFYVHLRCRWLKLPLGDQALFVKRELFLSCGGYRAELAFMEDMDLVDRLRRKKGFVVLRAPVVTSTRRHESDGYLKRVTLNFLIHMAYRIGIHPNTLARLY